MNMLHYLPGCDVKKNHPQALLAIEKYMQEKGAIIDQCCRNKDKFLEDNDIIVHNCTLCHLVLEETYPHTQIMSLYEYILKDEHFPWVDHHGESITIQDCWRTRKNSALQTAIRPCLKKMNYTIVEMEENYDKTKYCGVWLNNPPAKDCVEIAPKTFHDIIENHLHLLSQEEQVRQMQQWCQHYTTQQIAVYCNGCEKGIKLGGKQPIHMVELLAEGLI